MQQSVHNRQDSRSPCTETHITEEAAGPTGEKHCGVGWGAVFNQLPRRERAQQKRGRQITEFIQIVKKCGRALLKTSYTESLRRVSGGSVHVSLEPCSNHQAPLTYSVFALEFTPQESFSFSSQLTIKSQHDFIFISNLFNKEKYSSELPGRLHFSSFLLVQSHICVSRKTKPKPIHYKAREATCTNPGLQHIIVFFFPIKSFYLKQQQTLQLHVSAGETSAFHSAFLNAEGPVHWFANGSQQRPKHSVMNWKTKAMQV